jgi:hypothetical protein
MSITKDTISCLGKKKYDTRSWNEVTISILLFDNNTRLNKFPN